MYSEDISDMESEAKMPSVTALDSMNFVSVVQTVSSAVQIDS